MFCCIDGLQSSRSTGQNPEYTTVDPDVHLYSPSPKRYTWRTWTLFRPCPVFRRLYWLCSSSMSFSPALQRSSMLSTIWDERTKPESVFFSIAYCHLEAVSYLHEGGGHLFDRSSHWGHSTSKEFPNAVNISSTETGSHVMTRRF